MLLWSFICALLGVSQIILAANNKNTNVKNKNVKNLPQSQKQDNNAKSVFISGHERLHNKAQFVSVPQDTFVAHLEDIKTNGLAFTKNLIAHNQRAMQAAHPRNEILAKKNYLHLLLANSAIDFHLNNAIDAFNSSDYQSCLSFLQISLSISLKASHFHLVAHVPNVNRPLEEGYGKNYQLLEAKNFSVKSLEVIMKNVRHLYDIAQVGNIDNAAWMNNYLATCMKLIDGIKSLVDLKLEIQSSGLDESGIYEALHLYRMFGHFTQESLAFMKTNNFDFIRTFSASLSEVHSLLKVELLPKNNDVIEYLLSNKESKQMFPELVKQLAAAKEEQLRMEKLAKRKIMLKERQAARKAKEAEEAKRALEEAQYSPIKKAKTTPIRTDDLDEANDDPEIIDDGDNDNENAAEEERPFSLSEVSDTPSFSESEVDEFDLNGFPTVDPRDIDYGFILVGQFIKEEFLDPFRENYLGPPEDDHEPSWTEFLELIDEDDEEVQFTACQIGIKDIEFLRSVIIFYQKRNEICHPTNNVFSQTKEDIALNLRLLFGKMVPVQYSGIKSEVESICVNGEMVDLHETPADYVPLKNLRRPRGFDRASDVEATLASIKLYQLLFTALLMPLAHDLGLSKPDHIDYEMMQQYRLDHPDSGLTWATVYRMRHHLRPFRNRLCHKISSLRSVVAYAKMLARERPEFKTIMLDVVEKATEKLADVKDESEEENNVRVNKRGTYGFNNFVRRVVL